MPKNTFNLDKNKQLEIAINIGADVWVEKLLKEKVMIKHEKSFIENVLNSKNGRLIKLFLENGLNCNKSIKTDDFMNKFISVFHIAVFSDLSILNFLVNHVEKITVLPLLHVAAIKNDLSLVQEICQEQLSIQQKDLCGYSALDWALLLNNYEMAAFLIEKGAKFSDNKNFHFDLPSILKHMIKNDYIKCLTLLLENNLSPNTFIYDKGTKMTLMVCAAKYGKLEIMRLLMVFGANPNVKCSQLEVLKFHSGEDSVEISAINSAAKNGHIECVDFLLNYCDINDIYLEYSSKDYKHYFADYDTPLLTAIKKLNDKLVNFLLVKGANPNINGLWYSNNKKYETDKNFEERKIFILSKMLHFNSDLTKEINAQDYEPEKLNFEKSRCWFNILRMLLNYKIDINNVTEGHWESAYFIISLVKNSITHYKDNDVNESLGWSEDIDRKNQEKFKLHALKILFEYPADLNKQDDSGKTILHYAAEKKYISIVRYLIETAKVDFSIKDKQGETAIFSCARNVDKEMFRYLKNQGLSVEKTNTEGKTPLLVLQDAVVKKFTGDKHEKKGNPLLNLPFFQEQIERERLSNIVDEQYAKNKFF